MPSETRKVPVRFKWVEVGVAGDFQVFWALDTDGYFWHGEVALLVYLNSPDWGRSVNWTEINMPMVTPPRGV